MAAEYSAVSQRTLLKRDEFSQKLADLNHKVEALEKQTAAEEREKENLANGLTGEQTSGGQRLFNEVCDRITRLTETLRIFKDRIAKTQAELDALTLTPEKQKARTQRQEEMARLASDRLEKDRRTDSLVKDLRALLKARAELTARMAECADDIDLTLAEDGLEAARFDDLLAALPVGVAEESERWCAQQLGKEKGVGCYIVRDDRLVLPETLQSNGVYYFSDPCKLKEEQARELLNSDPPSIMTFAGHMAAKAKAGMRGVSTREVVFWEDVDRAISVRKEQAARSQMPQVVLRNIPAHGSNGFSADLRIRAKVKSPIQQNGRLIQRGESIEALGSQEAWRMALSGTITAPWEG